MKLAALYYPIKVGALPFDDDNLRQLLEKVTVFPPFVDQVICEIMGVKVGE